MLPSDGLPSGNNVQGGYIVVEANSTGSITYSITYSTLNNAIAFGNNFQLFDLATTGASVKNLNSSGARLPWIVFGI